jgi:hypothetical protein
MTQGWYLSADSKALDADNKATGEPNVAARFEDHKVLDGEASRKARKNVYRPAIVLKTRIIINVMGFPSSDVAGRVMKFEGYPDEAAEALKRYPEAWRNYQAYRTAPIQPGEREIVAAIFGEPVEPVEPKAKRGPKPKAAQQPENVVQLKAMEA